MVRQGPTKWLEYTPVGRVVEDTPFVPFKTPIDFTAGLNSNQRFTISDLVKQYPRIKLVIDLTKTLNYYNSAQFENYSIEHIRIPVSGNGYIPLRNQIQQFYSIVAIFLAQNPNDLIGVHCSHGINRTGYMICRWLIENKGYEPQKAMDTFARARGHSIERNFIIKNLLSLKSDSKRQDKPSQPSKKEVKDNQASTQRDQPGVSKFKVNGSCYQGDNEVSKSEAQALEFGQKTNYQVDESSQPTSKGDQQKEPNCQSKRARKAAKARARKAKASQLKAESSHS